MGAEECTEICNYDQFETKVGGGFISDYCSNSNSEVLVASYPIGFIMR